MDIGPLRQLADELGVGRQVIWDLRFIEDAEIPVLFEQADVVVFPYKGIDQSGALMTAVHYGTPIVATRVGGFREILQDGTHAYLASPEDPIEFAHAMEKVLCDPDVASRMRKAVQSLAEETPTWDEIGQQTMKVYEIARAGWVRGANPKPLPTHRV